MPDMLARLKDLPGFRAERDRLASEGVPCRRAEPYERAALFEFPREALANEGYGYAIIGGVGPAPFYEKVCGAFTIPGSDPGI